MMKSQLVVLSALLILACVGALTPLFTRLVRLLRALLSGR
jgi:hypothetical protein